MCFPHDRMPAHPPSSRPGHVFSTSMMNASSFSRQSLKTSVDFTAFLEKYRAKLHHLFNVKADFNKLSLRRGLPASMMEEIRSCDPLSVYIPTAYGGRGGHIHEGLAVLAASSYESLALSLTFGINGALFLQPLSKYGHDQVKASVFDRFLRKKTMGGLMITEPDYGTDALNMRTAYVEQEDGYHVQGLKHWGGLTGWADYWLISARRQDAKGQLSRDIDFFVCDVNTPGQEIEVEELFKNLGLYLIPYGRNRINVRVPKSHRLQPESTGLKMMLDTLHRSRIQFPGMGMGYLKRLLDEALTHCKERYVGGMSLFNYDQVKQRLARLQASFTICSAMCTFTSEQAEMDKDMAKAGLPANATKSVLTDLMQEAAQSLLQLVGASGYRLDHIAGRSLVDSRPFQIFEGPNDVLYQQISEAVLKLMRRCREVNLYQYLKTDSLTARASEYFKKVLNFDIDLQMPQRKMVELGRVLGRIISMEMVIELGERGFRHELVSNGLTMLRQEVESLMASYNNTCCAAVVEDYSEDSSWLHFVHPDPS